MSKKLLPDRYSQRDFFTADIADVAGKDDRASMEHPIFSISKNPDTEVRTYEHNDVSVTITPSAIGRATIWDKDILIFGISQMMEAKNRGREDVHNRRVRFVVRDFLRATNRPANGKEYRRIEEGLDRLQGTKLKTNIMTGGKRNKNSFQLIDGWSTVERASDGRMEAIELTLSEWMHNAVQAHEVLTINRAYFRLAGGLERRLYELARKHCGAQPAWKVSLEVLQKKSGSQSAPREFRRMLKKVITNDTLPDYRMSLDPKNDMILFYTKDPAKQTALTQFLLELKQN